MASKLFSRLDQNSHLLFCLYWPGHPPFILAIIITIDRPYVLTNRGTCASLLWHCNCIVVATDFSIVV